MREAYPRCEWRMRRGPEREEVRTPAPAYATTRRVGREWPGVEELATIPPDSRRAVDASRRDARNSGIGIVDPVNQRMPFCDSCVPNRLWHPSRMRPMLGRVPGVSSQAPQPPATLCEP